MLRTKINRMRVHISTKRIILNPRVFFFAAISYHSLHVVVARVISIIYFLFAAFREHAAVDLLCGSFPGGVMIDASGTRCHSHTPRECYLHRPSIGLCGAKPQQYTTDLRIPQCKCYFSWWGFQASQRSAWKSRLNGKITNVVLVPQRITGLTNFYGVLCIDLHKVYLTGMTNR